MKNCTDMPFVPFIDWLQLMFIYLKLTNQINWNWIFVILPFVVKIVVRIISSVWKEHLT